MNNSSLSNFTTTAPTFSPVNVNNRSNEACYDKVVIPRWGFNSTCDWVAATYSDLVLSCISVLYNAVIFLLPFVFRRLRNTIQGGFLSSYAAGCFLCSAYFVYVDVRVLVIHDQVPSSELGMHYILLLFLAYHVMFHMYVLCWDQYRCVFRCNSHLRYVTSGRLVKVGIIVWLGSMVTAIVEASFFNNLSMFPATPDVSQFRMVCVVLLLFFFWFVPLLFVISWNGDLFCFLLKLTHNGYVIEEPIDDYKPELMPELAPCPWHEGEETERKDDGYSFIDDEETELPTIPDDIPFELRRSFFHFVVLTLFAAPMFVWLSYHLLAMMRTGEYLAEGWRREFYDTIYNCYTFISLYFAAKLTALLNPLGCFYYLPEIYKIMRCTLPWFGFHKFGQ